MTFSQQLQRIIENSGMTRYELAKRSGVTQGALSLFINGKRGLTTETLDKLAPVLGLSITFKPDPQPTRKRK